MLRDVERDFLISAIQYECGEPTTIFADFEWDAIGDDLQAHPEKWTEDFKKLVYWKPGVIEKTSNLGIDLFAARGYLSDRKIPVLSDDRERFAKTSAA